ncbi:zinc protease [Psychrobacter sp. PL15]|uniref:M16 family metallopeptidase n=1 Tax=Psychrobacter sp. PL15 TaxID=3071719 RepID=UPI002E048A68|nr:zinc protease [Psychrobacter sp. PL15]
MTHKTSKFTTKKTALAHIPNSTRSTVSKSKQLSYLSMGIAIGLVTLTLPAYADSAGATDARASSAAIDANAPIAALSKLSSLDNVKPLQVTVPNVEHFKTTAGVPVSFVRAAALPIVDIDLRFNAGSARDGDVRSEGFGIANMTATMLTQGTQSLDENEFTRAVETLGINLSSGAYKDMFIVSLRSLSDDKHLLPAVDLMTQMLTKPTFDPEILARNKARLLVGLQQQKQDPGSLASLAFSQALYGKHPYAHPSSGTLESVPSIVRKDLTDFQKNYLVAANASLAMTGNLTLVQAKALAEEVTANLPIGKAAAILPEPKTLDKAQRIHIPFPSSQTTVLMGQLGDKRATDPKTQQQQTNFAIGNDVLAGGDFNARLMTEIRQNLGYTYGISGSMSPMLARGPYQIGFATRNDKARAAIDASLDVINDTLDQGITSAEMRLTTDNLKNSFPMSFASNAGINSLLGMMNFYQLPDSYLTDYVNRIDRVQLAGVNQTMRDTLKPDNFLIVTVGQDDPWQKDADK